LRAARRRPPEDRRQKHENENLFYSLRYTEHPAPVNGFLLALPCSRQTPTHPDWACSRTASGSSGNKSSKPPLRISRGDAQSFLEQASARQLW